jgi:hypothetical protein
MLCVPGISLRSQISVNLAIPYWSISIALNLGITACIAARLLYMRYQTRQVIDGSGAEYVSVTAMLVESAALYSTNGLLFLITYAINSPAQNLFLPILGQTQVCASNRMMHNKGLFATQSISPLLIILRVLHGRAWSSASLTRFEHGTTDVRFAQNGNITTVQSSDTSPTLFMRSKPVPFGGSGTSLKA